MAVLAQCVQGKAGVEPLVVTPVLRHTGRELPAELAVLCLSVMSCSALAAPVSAPQTPVQVWVLLCSQLSRAGRTLWEETQLNSHCKWSCHHVHVPCVSTAHSTG